MATGRRAKLVLAVGVAVLVLLGANVAGMLRYPGGPLRESNADGWFWLDTRPADQGNNREGFTAGAGIGSGEPIYLGLYPRNQWSTEALIEDVRLIGATDGLALVDARALIPGRTVEATGPITEARAAELGVGLYTDYQPLPASLPANSSISDGRMWVKVIANDPGEQSFESVAVDYRIGPFSFTIVLHQAFTGCFVPLAAGATCSIGHV